MQNSSRTAVDLEIHGATDAGRQRSRNEDQFLIADLIRGMDVAQTSLGVEDQTALRARRLGKLLLIADGIGGQHGGQRASRIAVETIAMLTLQSMRWFYGIERGHPPEIERHLAAAMRRAEVELERAGSLRPAAQQMGTTLTVGYLLWPQLYLVHAGDSRCYLQRRGELLQLTRDHTTAQRLVDSGAMDAEAAQHSPFSNILDNAVLADVDRKTRPDVLRYDLEVGDVLLFCTDGLTNMLDDEEVQAVLVNVAQHSAEQACRELINRAKEAGGADNVTTIVVRSRALA